MQLYRLRSIAYSCLQQYQRAAGEDESTMPACTATATATTSTRTHAHGLNRTPAKLLVERFVETRHS